MDHHAELEQFGIRHKFRRRQAKKNQAFLKMPKRARYRCMACGNEFREFDLFLRSNAPHHPDWDLSPFDLDPSDDRFRVTPFPIHDFTDSLRTV